MLKRASNEQNTLMRLKNHWMSKDFAGIDRHNHYTVIQFELEKCDDKVSWYLPAFLLREHTVITS